MKLFIDSANPKEIRSLWNWGVFDGITTTPTFFRKLDVKDVNKAIADLAAEFDGELHVEALGKSVGEIVDVAQENSWLGRCIVSKIPISPEALAAVRILRTKSVVANVHLVFTVSQAIFAAKAGAAYVCPLMGRMKDAGICASKVVTDIVNAIGHHTVLKTEVMASSIRDPESAYQAFLSGAQAMTLPPVVAQQLLESPLTSCAMEVLLADAEICSRKRRIR